MWMAGELGKIDGETPLLLNGFPYYEGLKKLFYEKVRESRKCEDLGEPPEDLYTYWKSGHIASNKQKGKKKVNEIRVPRCKCRLKALKKTLKKKPIKMEEQEVSVTTCKTILKSQQEYAKETFAKEEQREEDGKKLDKQIRFDSSPKNVSLELSQETLNVLNLERNKKVEEGVAPVKGIAPILKAKRQPSPVALTPDPPILEKASQPRSKRQPRKINLECKCLNKPTKYAIRKKFRKCRYKFNKETIEVGKVNSKGQIFLKKPWRSLIQTVEEQIKEEEERKRKKKTRIPCYNRQSQNAKLRQYFRMLENSKKNINVLLEFAQERTFYSEKIHLLADAETSEDLSDEGDVITENAIDAPPLGWKSFNHFLGRVDRQSEPQSEVESDISFNGRPEYMQNHPVPFPKEDCDELEKEEYSLVPAIVLEGEDKIKREPKEGGLVFIEGVKKTLLKPVGEHKNDEIFFFSKNVKETYEKVESKESSEYPVIIKHKKNCAVRNSQTRRDQNSASSKMSTVGTSREEKYYSVWVPTLPRKHYCVKGREICYVEVEEDLPSNYDSKLEMTSGSEEASKEQGLDETYGREDGKARCQGSDVMYCQLKNTRSGYRTCSAYGNLVTLSRSNSSSPASSSPNPSIPAFYTTKESTSSLSTFSEL